MSALTPKQARFVEEYLVDLNGAQAAIRAGYSAKTAKEQAARLLTKVHVTEAISAAQQARSTRTEITQDRVLEELAKIGFSDIRRIFTDDGGLQNPSEMSDDMAAAVQSVEVVVRQVPGEDRREVEHVHKIKLNDKLGALTQIGRHLGMFTDNVNAKVSGGVTVNIGSGPDADL
jgi:phage terminase small subunit